jgi:hypothetical protein
VILIYLVVLQNKQKKTEKLKTIRDAKQSHMEIMGPMLEDLELDLRNTIEGVYFQKTKEIINGMRVTDKNILEQKKKQANLMKESSKN